MRWGGGLVGDVGEVERGHAEGTDAGFPDMRDGLKNNSFKL